MKTDAKQVLPKVVGISQVTPQSPDGATEITNFCSSRIINGWDNRIGIEPISTQQIGFGNWGTWSSCVKIHSVFHWATHKGAKSYLLYEEQDKNATDVRSSVKLKYYLSNGPQAVEIDTQRHTPAPNMIGSYYEPYGKYLIICNGHDETYKFDGYKFVKLGFSTMPSPPRPWGVSKDTSLQTESDNLTIIPMRQFPPDAGNGQVRTTHTTTGTGFRDNLKFNFGLGTTTDQKYNTYRYKVTFVKEDGSESMPSLPSEPVTWQSDNTGKRHGVWVEDIPRGNSDEGVIARRIYRTKNTALSDSAVGTDLYVEDEVYYFVTQIDNNVDKHFFDTVPDTGLGALAPRNDHSIFMPARPTMAATFKNCLFINGGEGDGGTLFYSLAGKPCQYPALNYFSVGSTDGGEITALKNFNDVLLVFREEAIDMVIGDPIDGFKYVPLIKGIGCPSRNGMTIVPNVGCVFINKDGVFNLIGSGGSNGSSIKIKKISQDIDRHINRLNHDMLSKAQACYSKKWKEIHFYTCIDGSQDTNIGFVFHLDHLGWSFRDGFQVNCVTVDNNGEIIFGDWNGFSPDAPLTEPDSAGLYFVSGFRSAGTEFNLGTDQIVAKAPLLSKFISREHDFGYGPQKKAIKYLYFYALSEGNNTIAIKYYADRDYKNPITSQGQKLQPSELPDLDVYNLGTFDSAVWERKDLITVRYDIANKKLSYFRWEFETVDDIQFIGYSLEFNTDSMRTRQGKT